MLEVCGVVDSIRQHSKQAAWLIQRVRARSARRGRFNTPTLEASGVVDSLQ